MDRKENPAAYYGVVKLDGDGRIKHALPCAACGYDLRSQLPSSDCPECGADIRSSMRAALRGSLSGSASAATWHGRLALRLYYTLDVIEYWFDFALVRALGLLVGYAVGVGIGMGFSPYTLVALLAAPLAALGSPVVFIADVVTAFVVVLAMRTDSPKIAIYCVLALCVTWCVTCPLAFW